jgi:hypothetical protein
MTFRYWFYNVATEVERAEAKRLGEETECLEADRKLRRRTAFKLGKLCTGKGWTIEQDPTCFYMRWRVVPAKAGELLQFADAESALAFAREEKKTVADWLQTIAANWLVMPNGKAVLL